MSSDATKPTGVKVFRLIMRDGRRRRVLIMSEEDAAKCTVGNIYTLGDPGSPDHLTEWTLRKIEPIDEICRVRRARPGA
jgi:hypothetical protein